MNRQKRFQNNFIYLFLCAVLGLICAITLYEYGGYFHGSYSGAEMQTGIEGIKELLLCCYSELKLYIIIFLFGFCVFSGIVSTAAIAYRGFMYGLALKIYAQSYSTGSITQKYYILLVATGALMLFSYIIIATEAICYSSQIRYTGNDFRSVFSNRMTKNYISLFLLYTVIISVSTALRVYLTSI